MTTPEQAIASYRQYQARQAGQADPVSAGQAPVSADPVKAANHHAALLLTPAYRQAAQQRAAETEAERRAALPAPRETLRQAHQTRAAARAEAERLQAACDRARAHLAEVTATRDAAKRALDAVAAADTRHLIDELAAGSAGRVEPGAGAERVALAAAEHQVEIAQRAADRLAGDLAAAQQRLAAAVRAVAEGVCAVLLEFAQREALAILAAADALDAQRAGLDALGLQISNLQRSGGAARLPWPPEIRTALTPELRAAPRLPSKFSTTAGDGLVRRWSEVAAALGVDPETEAR